MTKQLIAIALAAAFGIAHAADVKPAVADMTTAAPAAAVVKAEAPKAEVKAPEAKPAVAAPEMKKEEAKHSAKPVKKAHKEKKMVKKVAPVATPDATKAVEPATK